MCRNEQRGTEARRHEGTKGRRKSAFSPRTSCLRASVPSCLPGRSAFSLVEFTAVLALMAIVAGIVTLSIRPLMVKGKQDAARTEIAQVCGALESFYTTYNRYPSNAEGLSVLRQKTEKLTEPLLTRDAVDPWGNAYQYNAPGREGPYEVLSFGADGKAGGDGGDKDIGSWELKDARKK
jgi:general secretion pathway protein G